MRGIIPAILMAILLSVSPVRAENSSDTSVTLYLGLSIPYPDSVPVISLLGRQIPESPGPIQVVISVGKKGKIKDVEYRSELSPYIEPIIADIKKITFSFLPGEKLSFPIKIPAEVRFTRPPVSDRSAKLKFPVSPGIISDSTLLLQFFEQNGVTPPKVAELPPVFYKVDPSRDKADYLIVTARVFLDENGQLENITYPIAGQIDMAHQVHMALINARFTPAIINSRPRPSDFLVTFRIFDNIRYPFSPSQPVDSNKTRPLTAGHFMARYFNPADIFLPPLPRNHGSGIIKAAGLARRQSGTAFMSVTITDKGKVNGVRIWQATPGLAETAREAIDLVDWYPAVDHSGKALPFSGLVTLRFDGLSQVVYIPEWLKP